MSASGFGFVFMDKSGRVYMVKKWVDDVWLFYWHEFEKHFVSLRPVFNHEVDKFIQYKMKEDWANQYWKLQHEYESKSYPIMGDEGE